MFTPFGDERKRKINLGGASSAVTHTALLDRTKALRNERLDQQRRQKSALRVQAWWRSVKEARVERVEMRRMFEGDVTGLVGLRCLAVIGRKDSEALAIWSQSMAAAGPDVLFALGKHPQVLQSWLVLIKQVAFFLLRSVAGAPQSQSAMSHLKVLNALLSPTTASQALEGLGAEISAEITNYLLNRDFYALLSCSITGIPPDTRSPALALTIQLVTLPFQTFQLSSPPYTTALNATLTSILTIPLLPNRISTASLTLLSSQIPFSPLPLLDVDAALRNTTPDDKVNLIANLQVFIPPRYKVLEPQALATYFRLLAGLLNAIPITIFNPLPPKTSTPSTWSTWAGDHSDSDSDSETGSRRTRVSIVTSFNSPLAPHPHPEAPISPPDARTLRRLSTLPTTAHLKALLSLPSSPASRPALIALLFALSTIWPADVAPHVLAVSPALVREVYRSYVRGSGLGRDGEAGAVMDAARWTHAWPALLLLVELYTKAMLTMGDDEFFGTSGSGSGSVSGGGGMGGRTLGGAGSPGVLGVGGGGGAGQARNPLTLDELAEWSRQLLNIAFALYWREDAEAMRGLVDGGVRCTWEGVREKVTKCLVGIHARDSRKPFVPQDHWLVTSQIDVQSFVEAAIFEERELSNTASTSTSPPPLLRPSAGRMSAHQQTHSKRQLAYLSPRLGVLNNIPFAIPFDVRVSIFRHFVLNDAVSRASSSSSSLASRGMGMFFGHGHGGGRTRVQVRRGSVAQDGFDRLAEADLKAPIEIAFIDQFGAEEAGIDGGGVFKEFFTSLCKEVFDTDRGLWLANKKNELYPNPHAYATESHSLNWYRFIGRILGKAMYEGILVDVAFAGFFLAKWLGKQSFLDDLASLDPDLYNGLIFLKHYTGNLEDLALNFTIAIDEFGDTRSIDLIPNGSNIAVTRENRLQYIQFVAHYRLTKQIKLQSEAFFEGLSEMIDPKWIRMFNQQEIQILLGGVNAPIDFEDLRRHTNYGGLYDDNEETIVAFWNVVNAFDQEQRMALLRFVTSCSRPPLLGFKELVPNFSIRDASADVHRLPTSSTCVNLLKLPRYKSEKQLRDKLLQAITSNAGFDLS
ncbi:hypothetical protein D9615_010487 [Tricholomella constricta]|uniref:HECT-type E3 ubiquitin transferase n=1 Tax=Tricholomella constricta TaxID=117010 RepID=A0A8H5LSL3_9AGAR|nr:hypothetical protein D9615_010487 [Tricholomella constricta]